MNNDVSVTKLNLDNVFILDNFLPEFLHQHVQLDFGANFNWKLGHTAIKGGNVVFGSTLYQNDELYHKIPDFPWTVSLLEACIRNKMQQIQEGWMITNITRIRANGQMPNQPANIHLDRWPNGETNPKSWSFLYYVSDSDGNTDFYDDEPESEEKSNVVFSLEYKPNRGVLFPSHYFHKGNPPTKDWRVSINFMMDTNFGVSP